MLQLTLLLLALLLCFSPTASAETFRFAALGDMPYGGPSVDHPRLQALIGAINARKPAFTIHIGDIKSGSSPCTDDEFLTQLRFLNTFEQALVYTPGDNEWTDCHRQQAGRYDVLERLARLRTLFFAAPHSLGKTPLFLERQSEAMAHHKLHVENARFVRGGVQFLTLHVVGSNNNLDPTKPANIAEHGQREAANIAWLGDTLTRAHSADAKAVVIALHADMLIARFDAAREMHTEGSGFRGLAEALIAAANVFAKPVLLIHGDSHSFRTYLPFPKRAPNVSALEVFGPDEMHAVEVIVDITRAEVFSFGPIWNPMR